MTTDEVIYPDEPIDESVYTGQAMSFQWILQEFKRSGGTVTWISNTNERISATYHHPETGITLTLETNYPYTDPMFVYSMHKEGIMRVFKSVIHEHWLKFTSK